MAAFLYWPGGAVAGDGVIEKFFGSFSGHGTWGTGTMPRDINVVIQPPPSGFNVSWDTTSLRDPKNLKRKSHTLDFLKIRHENVFVSEKQKDRSDIPVSANPMQGPMPKSPLIWARIKDNTLSLYAFDNTSDGRADVQAYHRTLNGDKMKLHFIRYLDGTPVKQTKGKMRRIDK
jgi:hypothetical protein